MKRKPKKDTNVSKPVSEPDPIKNHVDGCTCARCEKLEPCPVCKLQKLDIDWCYHCSFLIF